MPSEHRSSHMPAAKRSMSMQENLGANGVKMPAVAAPVQCVIIPEVSKKPLPDQEVWEEVAYYLEDVSIARDHLKWMKEYLSRNEMKRKSFKTYEDVGDFLMEKANRQFNTTYHAAAETAGEDKNEQGEQADKGSGMAGLFNSGMMGLVKYLALFSAVQGMIPGAQAQGLPGNGPLALGDGATHGGGAGITSFPQICPPMSTMGNATNSTALTPLPQCPVPQPLSSPSYNVGSLLNLLPLERGLTTQTGAGMIRGMGVYKDKIGLNKAQEDRTIAPEEIDFLEGASSEEFIGRFTPYALSVLKSSRVAETEKANAMAHFNYQAYLSGNQGKNVQKKWAMRTNALKSPPAGRSEV